jgi:hypothetical protein
VGREVRKLRKKQKLALIEFPPSLYNAFKAEARSQGLTVRECLIKLMEKFNQEGPAWRAFLAEKASQVEVRQRGPIKKQAGATAAKM